MTHEVALPPQTVTCHSCGEVVPAGEFCGLCGAHLVADMPGSAHRPHAFAANPHEHMLHLSAVSTLFPHLPHRRTAPFRIALAVAVLLLVVLGYLRLTGPAIAAAALAVPILYLLYLYEVEVYEDEPIYVIAATFVLGGVLGGLWAHFTGNVVTQTLLQTATPQGAPTSKIVLTGVIFPLVAQLLLLAGPIVLYLTRDYKEALDGFAFGAACAMGFTLVSTFVYLAPEMEAGLTSVAPALDNTLRIVLRGLLIPFIYASTTGLIGGALWTRRNKGRALRSHGWTTTLQTAVLVAVVVQVGLGLLDVEVLRQGVITLVYAVVAALLLLSVRVALHHMLLSEATETEIGPSMPCFHCHRIVPRMSFCPHCGVASRAMPKTGVGRVGR